MNAFQCLNLTPNSVIAFDTEFISDHIKTNNYYPYLCLMQIGCGGKEIIIDPLISNKKQSNSWMTPELKACKIILEDQNIVKVIHDCRFDVQILHNALKLDVKNIFDTQVAYMLVQLQQNKLSNSSTANISGKSYQDLTKLFFNINISKESQFSDWQKRPLSKKQLDYAVQDVRFLTKIYEILLEKIENLGLVTNFITDSNIKFKIAKKSNIFQGWTKKFIQHQNSHKNAKSYGSYKYNHIAKYGVLRAIDQYCRANNISPINYINQNYKGKNFTIDNLCQLFEQQNSAKQFMQTISINDSQLCEYLTPFWQDFHNESSIALIKEIYYLLHNKIKIAQTSKSKKYDSTIISNKFLQTYGKLQPFMDNQIQQEIITRWFPDQLLWANMVNDSVLSNC